MRMMMATAIVGAILLGGALASAQYGVTTTPPSGNVQIDKLRFRLVGDEPIQSPDGKGYLLGFKAVVIRDVKEDNCYTMFVMGAAVTTTGPSECPK